MLENKSLNEMQITTYESLPKSDDREQSETAKTYSHPIHHI